MDVKFGAPSIHSLQDLEIQLPHWIIFIANIFAKNCTLNSANLFWGFTKNVQILLFSLNLEDSHYVLILLNICYHTGIGLITWRPHFLFLRLHT